MTKKTNPFEITRTEKGSVEIVFRIPWSRVEKSIEQAAFEMGKDMTVAGFRKGKAPLKKVIESVSQEVLFEKALQKILPGLYGEAIKEGKINPIMYPKFQILNAKEGEDWEIKAVSAEAPEINLGDYKTVVRGALSAKSIWTPEKGKEDSESKKMSKEEVEQEAIKALLDSIEVKIPEILIEEEVNSKLSGLLERIEKLGLSLESYLASIGKTPQSLRGEYSKQAEINLKLEFILGKIAEVEKVGVEDGELNQFLSAAEGDRSLSEKLSDPSQKAILKSIIRKRKVLDSLASLG